MQSVKKAMEEMTLKRHVVGLGLLIKIVVVLVIISLSACTTIPTLPTDPTDPNPDPDPNPITTTNQVSLTVITRGSGSGDVSGCEGTCSKNYDKGTTLRLVATPEEGSTFARWLGPCTIDGNTCDVTLSDNYTTVEAEFVLDGLTPDPDPDPTPDPDPDPDPTATSYTLSVSLIGDGNGYIALDAANSNKLNCQAVTSCEAIIEKDSTVYIGAGADTGSIFAGFSGDCTGTATCGLQMTRDINIIAAFELESTQPPPTTPPTTPVTSSPLQITEIGYPLNIVDSAWLELYNSSNQSINLANYKLRSFSGLQADPYTAQGTREFDLPSVFIEANSYLILRAQSYDVFVDGPDQIFLNANGIVPRWGQNGGLLEITQNGQTVDVVRWGSTTSTPLSPSAWQGDTFTPQSTATYGGSFSRNLSNTDSNTASDWESKLFATPGGPNDVPANAHDVDIDGIPDSSEVPGSTFAGMDLYAMGARVGVRDIFVEVDYMVSNDEGIIPQAESLQMIVESFAKEGFAIHFDVGNALNDSRFNLGNQSVQVPYVSSIEQATALSYLQGRANFYDYKGKYMDPKRGSLFHYMLMGSSRNIDGSRGSGGVAELGGNDVLISLGGWGLNSSTEASRNMLVNFQASMIMHELGHNLGLEHGGNEQTNLKPNYLSIMNYLYSIYGVGPSTGDNAGDRFYVYNNRKSIDFCSIPNSPCGTNFILDYSHGRAQSMNETNIDELVGVGYGSAWVDYNDDNVQTRSGRIDINLDDNFSIINDFDDWGNLLLPFQRQIQGTAGPYLTANRSLVIPHLNDHQERIGEDAPHESFFNYLDAMNNR